MAERSILGLDLARVSGWAYGDEKTVAAWPLTALEHRAARHPVFPGFSCGSWDLGHGDDGSRFFKLWIALNDHRKLHGKPGLIVLEAPWLKPGDKASKIEQLFGYVAVVRLFGHSFDIDTRSTTVQQARKAFLGTAYPEGDPKKAVMAACVARGFTPPNTDASDAVAVFHAGVEAWREANNPLLTGRSRIA